MYQAKTMSLSCSADAISQPIIFGGKVIDFVINLVENYNFEAKSILYYGHPTTVAEDVNFCNVTVTYTHPGQNDTVHVETWLPIDNFNGRLQSIGGGGWVAGRYPPGYAAMSGAIGEGYATSATDAGLQLQMDYAPDSWALTSEGNPSLSLLQNFAAISLGDQLFMSTFWPQLIMQELDYFPYPCEMKAILVEAIEACDALDGIIDGIISNEDACDFDPTDYHRGGCQDSQIDLVRSEYYYGKFIWYGPNTGAQLSGQSLQLTSDIGLAMTTCTSGICKEAPAGLGEVWIKYWIEANPDWSYKNMRREAFDVHAHEDVQRYKSVIGTNDPDLTAFYKKGSKILGYHGTHDQLIPVKGTRHYYEKVKEIVPEVASFYRMFEVPGLLHCSGGKGGQPTYTFDALRARVENGTVPTELPHSFKDANGYEQHRLLCPYPQKSWLKINDSNKAVHKSTDFACV
ncbi:feruloyl esterase B precursor [Fusarium agapanthi]|uniref:Carboxylic ester hydrolase n=1 Tax=Fusarium agapanthi TaxID=1803897 RepID=A0A9P5E920_9HYPO|nr:feruloyl esterase B precursor [Fusarium agapanthi]